MSKFALTYSLSTVSKILHKKKKNRNPTYGNQLLAKGTEDWPSDNGKVDQFEQERSLLFG